MEVNKALALNQVDFWDKVDLTWPLAVHKLEARRGAKEDFKSGFFWKKFRGDRNQGKFG